MLQIEQCSLFWKKSPGMLRSATPSGQWVTATFTVHIISFILMCDIATYKQSDLGPVL